MKTKKILLVYVKGFINNVGYVEKQYHDIIKELVEEGRVIKGSTETTTQFEDGTRVTKMPTYSVSRGMRLTHLYIDERIYNLETGKMFIDEILLPCVIPEGIYTHADAKGKQSERIMIFGEKIGIKTLDKYNK